MFNDKAKVTGLELRDPDPIRPASSSGLGSVGDFVRGGGWIFVPILLLVLGGHGHERAPPPPPAPRRGGRAGLAGAGVIAVGRRVDGPAEARPPPRRWPACPVPARMFATSDPQVVAPVASATDDPRRDPAAPDRGRRLPRALPRAART